MRPPIAVAVAALACAAIAHPLRAQVADGQTLAGDAKTIASYRLTLPVLRKLRRVQDSMYALVASDPSLMTRYRNTMQSEDGPRTIDDMAKSFDRLPEMRRAIVAAGLTPRDYSLAMLTMFQAVMTVALMEMDGPMRLKALPAGVQPENVAFVKAHKTELDRMMRKSQDMERLARERRDSAGQSRDSVPGVPPRR